MRDLATTFAKRAAGASVRTALGTMNFGKRTPEKDAVRIIARAKERGVTVLDTANVYENGDSERIVGRALKNGKRDEWIVATKVGLARKGNAAEGLGPDTIRRACDESLARLGVDVIDLYYLHAPDPNTPIEATLEAMFELVRIGKVRAIGVSNYASWQILEMLPIFDAAHVTRPLVGQQIYNLLVRQLDVEYFRFAARYGVHTTTYNALCGGLLARDVELERIPPGSRFDKNAMYMRRYWTKAFFEAMDRYRACAAASDRTLAGFAYGWLAARIPVDSILLGPASVEQLDFALDAIAKPLEDPLMKDVDAIARDLAGTDASYAR